MFSMFWLSVSAFAQQHIALDHRPIMPNTNRDSLPYNLYHDLPAFNIRNLDSFSIFNTFSIPKGRPSLLILFDPDCKHCQMFTDELMKGMDSLTNIDMYWCTSSSNFAALRNFVKEHEFSKYKNIKVVGRDYEFFFSDYYGANFIPDMALYDENKKFVKLYQTHVTVTELYDVTHKK